MRYDGYFIAIILLLVAFLLPGCASNPPVEPQACDARLVSLAHSCVNEMIDVNQTTLDICSQPGGGVLEFQPLDGGGPIFIQCWPLGGTI